MFDVGIYVLNACRYLTGEEPAKFTAVASTIDKQDVRFKEMEESMAWTMHFPSGILATGSTTYGANMPGSYTVFGSKGRLEMNPAYSYEGLKLKASYSGGAGGKNVEIDEASTEKDPMQFTKETDHFSECILENRTPSSPARKGCATCSISGTSMRRPARVCRGHYTKRQKSYAKQFGPPVRGCEGLMRHGGTLAGDVLRPARYSR